MSARGGTPLRVAVTAALWLLARSGRADAPDLAPAAIGAAVTRHREAPREPVEGAGSVAKRVVAEALMGLGTATIGYLVAPEFVGAGCPDCTRAAALSGASAAFPIGVYWGGRLVHGDGSFWLTIAAPWLVSATTAVAVARDHDDDGQPALRIGTWGSVVAAPLSIVAFELSHAMSRASVGSVTSSSRLRVAVAPFRDGMGLAVAWQP